MKLRGVATIIVLCFDGFYKNEQLSY